MVNVAALRGKGIVPMHDIRKNVQIHMPFHLLYDGLLDLVIRERINPEISFNASTLDTFSWKDYSDVANRLLGEGLTMTFHAPFMDLRPGAIDPRIRTVSLERLKQVLDLVPLFRPRSVVCHPSFDSRYYVSTEELWLSNSIDTWTQCLDRIKETDTLIALENVYETEPRLLARLLDALPADRICFCFDTGHFNTFSDAPLENWMESIGNRIGQLHLHDNTGKTDAHLPVGAGTFPFRKLFAMLREKGLRPILTLEPHTEKDLWQTLKNVADMRLLNLLQDV